MAIIYIESNTTGLGEALLKASIKFDDVYFLTNDTAKYIFLSKLDPHINIINCDTSSLKSIKREISFIHSIKFVTSTSDSYIQMASEITKYLGLVGNTPDSVRICRDKLILQEALSSYSIKYPATKNVKNKEDLKGLKYPFIVKPREGTGSIGVSFVENEKNLPDFTKDSWICQEFIYGTEYSVETFTDTHGHHILALTRKFITKPPNFLELAHVLPIKLNNSMQKNIEETIKLALNAVGYIFGPAHTELKICGDSVTIIEINARFAGGMIPRLLEHSYGWSVDDLYIRSYLSHCCLFNIPKFFLTSCVSFIIPDVDRPYLGVEFPEDCVDSGEFRTKGKNEGKYDFSDRAGYVISTGSNCMAALRSSLRNRKSSHVLYDDTERPLIDTAGIFAIVYQKKSFPRFGKLTSSLLMIEKAHLLMLKTRGVISECQFANLKEAVLQLEAKPKLLERHRSGRGDYFDYEQYIISRCGCATGGMIQAARSRNDINATHLLLTIRKVISIVGGRVIFLEKSLIKRAKETSNIPLPIYSQYQTAMPGTLGHYLVAQAEIFLNSTESLFQMKDKLSTSPLGACAGAGTSFDTNTHYTADLLGFKRGPINSLSAITDKNPALQCLSLLIILSGNINRITQDLQLWTMREIDFLILPKEMYGGSSNMPQKNNPYLLEWLRLHHDQNIGQFMGALSSLTHIPTGNSYQASRSAVEVVAEVADKLVDMLDILTYAISGLYVDKAKTTKAIENGNVCATLVAETLVQQSKSSFREAHSAVGNALFKNDIDNDALKICAMELLTDFTNKTHESDLISERLIGGGGPADKNIQISLSSLENNLQSIARKQAASELRENISKQSLINKFKRG